MPVTVAWLSAIVPAAAMVINHQENREGHANDSWNYVLHNHGKSAIKLLKQLRPDPGPMHYWMIGKVVMFSVAKFSHDEHVPCYLMYVRWAPLQARWVVRSIYLECAFHISHGVGHGFKIQVRVMVVWSWPLFHMVSFLIEVLGHSLSSIWKTSNERDKKHQKSQICQIQLWLWFGFWNHDCMWEDSQFFESKSLTAIMNKFGYNRVFSKLPTYLHYCNYMNYTHQFQFTWNWSIALF